MTKIVAIVLLLSHQIGIHCTKRHVQPAFHHSETFEYQPHFDSIAKLSHLYNFTYPHITTYFSTIHISPSTYYIAMANQSARKSSSTKKTATNGSKVTSGASSASQAVVTGSGNTRKTKRKAEELESSSAATKMRKVNPSKTSKKPGNAGPGRPKAWTKPRVILNHRATDALNVYVFGSGDSGVLGLGPRCSSDDVARPRLNPNLSASSVGVVQIATGGMHCVALTSDNKIFTWGVNDHGALGRDTNWSGGWVDMDGRDHAEDSENSEIELNPKESTPSAIDESFFPTGTIFTQVAASDNASFALTEEGLVYGWGTFKVSSFVSFLEIS